MCITNSLLIFQFSFFCLFLFLFLFLFFFFFALSFKIFDVGYGRFVQISLFESARLGYLHSGGAREN
ncbi:hypothetical protein BDV36DRAFT_259288 [Aspergillus pseudocaelatus]|uniref:Uncharacterized protein n=1 Tax=Aspergillus pseudocaelatus TaxID=1825620 RepID=A0ABQ6WHR7_9EURO|nr:hypothetical protein BDV36DRAFT_259288 [Aspergillus pseudocaelatus]